MTAVASPPSFSNINRPSWGMSAGQPLNSMNHEEVRGMLMPRKSIQRTNSASSISSNSSTGSSSTLVSSNGSTNGAPISAAGDLNGWPSSTPRKRPPPKGQWPAGRIGGQADIPQLLANPARQQPNGNHNGASALHQQSAFVPQNPMNSQGPMPRPMGEPLGPTQPALYLLSLNGTFERKTISVPYQPETLRIGRQTNAKTVPTPINGFFDSKVLSRQHAEIWADRGGKVWIRDIKSSNGTFVNGTRLSAENRESEPHELQTSDHLELGIDIVSEDQKSVVHHKVAAKVEHAGFLSPSSSLLDMSFGDLDPANGAMMMSQMGGMQFRGRGGSQASMGTNGRLLPASNIGAQANGMGLQRGLWLTQPSTEAIVKKLHNEMRNARLQSVDLQRTHDFLRAMLSKEDIKNEQRPEVPEPSKVPVVNGNLSFRSDTKARFSDPPAPPPQHALPDPPDSRPIGDGDVPQLKRATTERPRSHPPNISPIREDNASKIIQLTELLNQTKQLVDTQQVKMRDLEDKLEKETEARKSAEQLARRLEEAVTASHIMNGSADPKRQESILAETFEPPAEVPQSPDTDISMADVLDALPMQADSAEASATKFRAHIDSMATEIKELKHQLEKSQARAEKAEAERDADRLTLAEMVRKIRQRDEDDARKAAQKARSSSQGAVPSSAGEPAESDRDKRSNASASGSSPEDPAEEQPTLSRANTITPYGESARSDPSLIHAVPYASMVGVVLFGMGLMAYLNGWQPQPTRLDR